MARIGVSERRLLKEIGEDGLSDRRENIAQKMGYSVHTINTAVSGLKRKGLVITSRFLLCRGAGRIIRLGFRRDAPSVINVTEEGRKFLEQAE